MPRPPTFAPRHAGQVGAFWGASGAATPGLLANSIPAAEPFAELLERAGSAGVVGVANRNSPGQVVLSGERAAIEAAVGIARTLGARRAVELPVSVAAHSPLMAEAAAGMRAVLADVPFADPRPPLLANADAHAIETDDDCRTELVDHLTTGVDWIGAIERMTAAGVTTFIEIGPGRVLTGLVKRIAPGAEAVATDDPGAPDRLAVPVLGPA